MSVFKPKRVSGADLAAQLSEATATLPTVTAPPRAALEPTRERPPPTVQVNFKVSEALADLIAREALRAGSTRRLIARLLRDAGHTVPEADLNPIDPRRRRPG